jgi:hypothetical protein
MVLGRVAHLPVAAHLLAETVAVMTVAANPLVLLNHRAVVLMSRMPGLNHQVLRRCRTKTVLQLPQSVFRVSMHRKVVGGLQVEETTNKYPKALWVFHPLSWIIQDRHSRLAMSTE